MSALHFEDVVLCHFFALAALLGVELDQVDGALSETLSTDVLMMAMRFSLVRKPTRVFFSLVWYEAKLHSESK
jgi:hypothetical protein